MKISSMILSAFCLVATGAGQDKPPSDDRLHLMEAGGPGAMTLKARSIERGVEYPSVVRLKGDVEIRGRGMIVRADEAEFHEETGEIEAHGTVRVTPYPLKTP